MGDGVCEDLVGQSRLNESPFAYSVDRQCPLGLSDVAGKLDDLVAGNILSYLLKITKHCVSPLIG